MKNPAKFNLLSMFKLVKSLSMSERIYFKKFASVNYPNEEGEFVKLFILLEGMKVFDRQKIEDLFDVNKPRSKINQAGLSLNYQLLGAMRAYNSNISVDTELKDSLRDMELLYIKGHYVQCKKLLEKAKKKASRYERLDRIIELLEWERKLVSKYIGIEHQAMFMQKIFDDLGEVLEKKLNLYQLEFCFNVKYSMIKRYNMIRSKEDLKRWKQMTDTSITLGSIRPLTFTGEIFYHHINSMNYFVKGQMEKVIDLTYKRFEVLNAKPDLIRDSPHQYITVLGNILTCRASLGIINKTSHHTNKKEFFKKLDVLREFSSNSIEIETRVFANSTIHEIGFYINTGDFFKASELSEKGTKQMKNLASRLGKGAELAFLYYSAYAHFVSQKYELAKEALNNILTKNYGEMRSDLQCFARILNLMLQYDMGIRKGMENTIIDAENFIVNKGKLYQMESRIIDLFRKIAEENLTANAIKKAFIELKKKLSHAAQEKYASNFDEYHHFMWWIESKKGGRSITEIAGDVIHKK
ncbi:MAG TPA: hypothetical protein EYN89_06185 [Flavobacteriales bacterium]|nr:hypothetical protein [Flavobacteriales bacterium]